MPDCTTIHRFLTRGTNCPACFYPVPTSGTISQEDCMPTEIRVTHIDPKDYPPKGPARKWDGKAQRYVTRRRPVRAHYGAPDVIEGLARNVGAIVRAAFMGAQ